MGHGKRNRKRYDEPAKSGPQSSNPKHGQSLLAKKTAEAGQTGHGRKPKKPKFDGKGGGSKGRRSR